MRLLLLSNSRNPGGEFLAHVRDELRDFLGPAREVFFVPYAGVTLSWPDYAARVRQALAPLGITIVSAGEVDDPVGAARSAAVFMVGGGNTFQLLRTMYTTGLHAVFRERVRAGVPYLGWSAGSNLACPTIRTTNDMPVVEPPSLDALGLVPFQVNPHYTDQALAGHGGETRDERIAEFLILNPGVTVLGLREGSWLRVHDGSMQLRGPHTAKRFRSDAAPVELAPGEIGALVG